MSLSESIVSVVGLGYIGLPTAAVLASVGHRVVGVEINSSVREVINRGDIHIVEPDLDELVRKAVLSQKLIAAPEPVPSDVFMIAVPTPFKQSRQPDLTYVQQAAEAIAPHLSKGSLVILESTSPVGTTEKLAAWLAEIRPDLVFPSGDELEPDVYIAYCPERVLPGRIVTELTDNDRIVGGLSRFCVSRAKKFYETFVRGQCLETDARTAEMTKLTENAFRDVNIAFANELSLICEELDIDVWRLVELANHHPRVNILNPGPGVGGHCIAVDPWFIVDSAPRQAQLIRTARQVNDSKPGWVVSKVNQAIYIAQRTLERRPVVACFGLTFKANIDDLRESPALEVCRQIATEHLGKLLIVEPHIDALPQDLAGRPDTALVNLSHALEYADILVLLVDHQDFVGVPKHLLERKVVIDTRGTWR